MDKSLKHRGAKESARREHPNARSRGTAMMETVLVLPLVLVVLALLFFFGQAMTRLQRSSVTDRYEAWRQMQYAPGPGAGFDKNPVEFGGAGLLDQAFFAGNARSLDIAERAGRIRVSEPTDLVTEAVLEIAVPSDDPVFDIQVASDMVEARHLRSPAWWRIDLATEHTSSVPLYQRFAGAVHHQHTVIDGDWSYGSWIEQEHRGDRRELGDILVNDVHFIGDDERNDEDIYPDLDSLRPHGVMGTMETFYEDTDTPLRELDDENDNPLAHAARLIYLSVGTYRGPQVEPELRPLMLWYLPMLDPDPGEPLE